MNDFKTTAKQRSDEISDIRSKHEEYRARKTPLVIGGSQEAPMKPAKEITKKFFKTNNDTRVAKISRDRAHYQGSNDD